MPSFATDSPLDYRIKKGVVSDTLAILGLTRRRRCKAMVMKKEDQQRRLMNKFTVGSGNNEKIKQQAHDKVG